MKSIKEKTIPLLTVLYTLFLICSIPYIRLFQDYMTTNNLKYMYDYVLYFLVFLIAGFILLNSLYRRMFSLKNIFHYGLTIILFGVGLSLVGETVERVHFLQYGIVVFLFFYSIKEYFPDLNAYLLTFSFSFALSILDEGIQWWVPSRTGEFRDIVINVIAILLSLTCIAFLWKPQSIENSFSRKGLSPLILLLIFVGAALTLFIDIVQIGYLIEDPVVGTFKSRYTAEDLQEKRNTLSYDPQDQIEPLMRVPNREKTETRGPSLLEMWKKEDFYRSEAEFHVGARNRLFARKDYFEAMKENQIIEKYYRPLVENSPVRWSADDIKRVNGLIESQEQFRQNYTSSIHKHLWVQIPRVLVWSLFLLFSCVMLFCRWKIRQK